MRANDEQLTKDFHEMEELTMELIPVLSRDRNRRNTLPSGRPSQTSIGTANNGYYHGSSESDESPRVSPKMKRPVSEYKKKPFPPLYVSQSTTNLHESSDDKASKDAILKSSVSLLQLHSSNDRRISIDSGLASADTEIDSLNFDLSFSTDVFAALANIHGISMTNKSTSTTV